MNAALKQVTQRPIVRPTYTPAETFGQWIKLNQMAVWDFWSQLDEDAGNDAERADATTDFWDFAKTQYETSAIAEADDADADHVTSTAVANAWQDLESDSAGVPMYGEI